MRTFLQLYKTLDSTTKTSIKQKALVRFFVESDDEDKVWAIALFSHKRPKRAVTTTLLRKWAAEESGIPLWLFEETYHIVGDLAETMACLLPYNHSDHNLSLDDWIRQINTLHKKNEEEKKKFIIDAWKRLNQDERFLFNKLLTGGFRLGVSQKSIINALAKHLQIEENIVTHRLMGNWDPFEVTYTQLLLEETEGENSSRPYPFYLAHALDKEVSELGKEEDWYAEWKWDGIRSQLIFRDQQVYLWSRGEEMILDGFPEFNIIQEFEMNSFVIDGELLIIKEDKILNFNDLQKRIGRKKVSKKTLVEYPAQIIAYDLMELNGVDLREKKQSERRQALQTLILECHQSIPLKISPLVAFESWDELTHMRESSRENNAEGFMLKAKDGTYKTGRKKGKWWKWKIDPYTIDAVLLYAQRGHGRRSNLFSDFTFAVWDGDRLVPFAKAYSGLTDVELTEITSFVRKNTKEKFGPVSSVTPELVFEISFEGIAKSTRHKSGVALRFPRITRWRKDKKVNDADHLNTLKNLL